MNTRFPISKYDENFSDWEELKFVPIKKNDLWGVSDVKKNIIIDYKYDNIKIDYNDNLILFFIENKIELTLNYKKNIIQISEDKEKQYYNEIDFLKKEFENVYKKELPNDIEYGFVGKNGFSAIAKNGFLSETYPGYIQYINGLWAIVNPQGFLITDYVYTNVDNNLYHENHLVVYKGGEWKQEEDYGILSENEIVEDDRIFKLTNAILNFVDESGKEIDSDGFQECLSFVNDLAPAKKNDLWGFIDKKGKWKIEPQYLNVNYFSSGLAIVHHQTLGARYIDINNNCIFSDFTYANHFSENIAVCAQFDLNNNLEIKLVDTNGVVIKTFPKIKNLITTKGGRVLNTLKRFVNRKIGFYFYKSDKRFENYNFFKNGKAIIKYMIDGKLTDAIINKNGDLIYITENEISWLGSSAFIEKKGKIIVNIINEFGEGYWE